MTEINQKWKIGDCQQLMQKLEPDSVDLVVTDPPYFMIDKNGNGFMGKPWDSINTDDVYDILCKSKEFVQFVIKFFMSMKVESNMDVENTVQLNVKTRDVKQQQRSNVSAPFVEKNLVNNDHKSKVNMCSVHEIVLTKEDLLVLLSGLSQNHTTVIENLSDSALFVVPISYIVSHLKNIVRENVLKLPTKITCGETKIQLTLMEEARIRGVIEGMIGIKLENPSTNEIITHVKYVDIIVKEKKFKHIILSNIVKHKTIHWIIWLLYVLSVTQQSNVIQKSFTKKDLIYDLIYKFHVNWLSEVYRVLKPGSFAFIMSSPRQDVLSQMINATNVTGFETGFTSIYWTYASGFPKASNIGKLVDKRLGGEREILGFRSKRCSTPTHGLGHGIYGNSKREGSNCTKDEVDGFRYATAPATPHAKALDGSYAGFQPKPAVEVIMVVMKPLSETTYVDQAMANGKGITWLDDGRIPYQSGDDVWDGGIRTGLAENKFFTDGEPTIYLKQPDQQGRFPANLLVSNDVLNDSNNDSVDSGSFSRYFDLDAWWNDQIKQLPKEPQKTFPFLITPKAGKSEKGDCNHPTVKPVKLFSWLITIGSRKNDLILDPFLGSGTTLEAGRSTGRRVLGFDISDEWEHLYPDRCMAHQPPLSNYI